MLPNEAAHKRLRDLADALGIMTRAQLTAMAPLVRAHREDKWAAKEWARDRWMARSQPERFMPAGSDLAQEQEQEPTPGTGATDAPAAAPGGMATPATATTTTAAPSTGTATGTVTPEAPDTHQEEAQS